MQLIDNFKNITDYFSPKVIGEVNDVFIKIALVKGEDIPWHNHKNEDELFYILEGSLLMEIEGEDSFIMSKGDLYIVKKGINHRISSKEVCKIMLVEPKQTAHTGEINADITKSIEDQIG